MARYLLSIDQGTTGSTAIVMSDDAQILGKATREFPQHFPGEGWVEHDLSEIWASVLAAVDGAITQAGVDRSACAAIGITNQRETTVLWDRVSGKALHRAIVWQDRRTAKRCAELREAGWEKAIRERTGLVLDPYFSGTKLEWLLSTVPGARERARKGELAFGTIDSWLLYRLTAGAVHATDVTNASRTLLFDIRKQTWDPELLELFGIPAPVLPTVRGCAEVYGHTAGVPGLPDGVPIAGIAGDQHAALFGQACFEIGDAKCTYGTGAFLLMNTGKTAVSSANGLITTIGWRIGSETVYALEGSAFIAGAAVQWLRDGLGVIKNSADVEALALQVPSTGGVSFVPALTGLGAPYWDPNARGLITGITRDTKAAHLARATLEGIALQIVDLAGAMAADAKGNLRRLRVDGGASASDLLMQMQSDFLGVPVDRPKSVETTAIGAAFLAGLGAAVFTDVASLSRLAYIEKTFNPNMTEAAREEQRTRWRSAVARTRSEPSLT